MQITAQNLDKILHDGSYKILARRGDDGNVHLGKIHPHEAVAYTVPTTYDDTDTLLYNLDSLERDDIAIIQEYPNRTAKRYEVTYGEVL